MSRVFAFRPGHGGKGSPQKIGDELDKIRSEHGTLTPTLVVDAARADDSPLHEAFEWDNDLAAEQYRLQQARKLIVCVRVLNGPVQTPIPAYVSVRTSERGREYLPTAEALSDDQIRERVLDEVRQALESIRRKYSFFQQAADVLRKLLDQTG